MRQPYVFIVLLPLFFACGNNNTASEADAMQGEIQPDGMVAAPCGELDEGRGACTSDRELKVCENSNLIAYECSKGSKCEPDPQSADGVSCFCDNAEDEFCPDEVCVDDPDCSGTSVTCDQADESYPGTLLGPKAFEGNPLRPDFHFLSFFADLNGHEKPDRLSIVAYYRFGVETGTFDTWDENDTWLVNLILDHNGNGFPPSAGELKLQSGTLTISSITGNMTGSLVDAVFVDSRSNPQCAVSVANLEFDLPIDQ